jgi:2-polyprenyl-6-methoxyphenol hydroxylase-like FAD-dependent oxidoreductase
MAVESTSVGSPKRFGGRHAVVIGGSMAGMLASRVLSAHFERVTLLERDRFPDKTEPRKGVPQEQHSHGLLQKAVDILEGYFPGLFEQLISAGGNAVDMSEAAWFHFGNWQARSEPGLTLYIQSRPLFDSVVRSRLPGIPNLRILDECEVVKPVASENRSILRGVEIRRRKQEGTELLEADLVVDASGRGSRMPRWLEELGLPRVEESHVRIEVGYASRRYRKPKNVVTNWKAMSIYPTPPKETRMGALSPVEGDIWLVSQAGSLGDHPPNDDAGFLEFARSLPQPHLYEILKRAEPLTPIAVHKFPSNMRRHYERLRLPEGLVVLGDALCSFNPLYGQGITLSALAATTLDECLAAQPQGQLAGLGQRFQARAASVLELPWLMATSEDLIYPSVEGPRPLWWKMMQGYANRLHERAAYDSVVSTTFAKMMHMTASPLLLVSPQIVMRALSAPRGSGGGTPPVLQFTDSPAQSGGSVTSVG